MRIHFTALAQADLADIVVHIAQDNIDAAYRVRDAVLSTFDKLLEHPHIAVEVDSTTEGLRRAVVDGYPNYLIFYLPVSDGIKILRIGSGRQDWSDISE